MADEQQSSFVPEVPEIYGQDGKPITNLDYSYFDSAFRDGMIGVKPGTKIPVLSPTGEQGYVPAEKYVNALDQGYKFLTPDIQKQSFLKEKYGDSIAQSGLAAAEGAARGLSLGTSDYLAKLAGLDTEAIKARREFNPIAAIGGEAAGIIAPLVLSGGAAAPVEAAGEVAAKSAAQSIAEMTPIALASKAGHATTAALQGAIGETAAQGIAKKIIESGIPKIAGSAVEGALFGAGNLVSEKALGDADMNSEYILAHIGESALLGGAIGAGAFGLTEMALPAIQSSIEKIKPKVGDAAKKAMSATFGVTPEQMDAYIARKPFLTPDLPELDEVILAQRERVQNVLSNLEEKKLGLKEANIELKQIESEFVDELKNKKYDAARAKELAQQEFKAAKENVVQQIKQDAVDIAPELSQTVRDLRNSAIAKSQEITAGLEGSEIDLNDAISKVKKALSEAEGKGTEYHQAAVKKIDSYLSDLKAEYPEGKIPAPILKSRIQGLDEITSYNQNATEFDKATNRLYKSMRYEFDDALKEAIPEYRKAMQPVAEDFKLLKSLDKYGDEVSAARSLKNFDDVVKIKYDLPMIQKLESRFGKDFSSKIERYLNEAEEVAKLPEKASLDTANKIKEFLSRPDVQKDVQAMLESSPEYQSVVAKQAELDQALAQKQALGGISTESVKGLLEKASRGDAVALERIKALGGPEFTQQIQDIGLKAAFEKGFLHGSRNINLGAIAGGAIGGLPGGAVGAGVGAIIDKMGPKIAQKILDKYVTLAALERMGIDVAKRMNDSVKTFLRAPTTTEGVRRLSVPVTVRYMDRKKIEGGKVDRSKRKDKETVFFKRMDELKNVAGDPGSLIARVSDHASTLNEHAPAISNALALKSASAAQYLINKAPKDPLAQYQMNANHSSWVPSDYELAQFDRIYAAVDNPMTVLEDLKEGKVTHEQIDAVKNVYPKIYQELVGQIIDYASSTKDEISYQKKLQLSTLFGVPLDFSMTPQFVNEMQTLHAAVNEQQSQSMPVASSKPLHLGEAAVKGLQSATEKTLTRA